MGATIGSMDNPRDVLVVERSQRCSGLWRFGRADEPHALWGLIERNDIGGIEVVKAQGHVERWRDDRATALCLVATRPDDARIEYDLSWRPTEGPLYASEAVVRTPVVVHHETLGERAARQRSKEEGQG
jgi:hypothetical protein